jgi:hypothetical protein
MRQTSRRKKWKELCDHGLLMLFLGMKPKVQSMLQNTEIQIVCSFEKTISEGMKMQKLTRRISLQNINCTSKSFQNA